MIVVSNTSPVTNLAAIGQFDLLRHLYSELYIAQGVWDELNAGGKPWPGSKEVSSAHWAHRHSVRNQSLVTALRRDIDRGEAESIALALEMGADLILLDEKEGRHLAQRLGLRPLGVIGILLEAKKKGIIENVRIHLDGLRQTAGFWMTETFYHTVLKWADEDEMK